MAIDLKGKVLRRLRLPTTDYNSTPVQITPAQQGDLNSRYFQIEMYDDRGNIDLSIYDTVVLSATTLGDDVIISEGQITDGKVIVYLSGGMLEEKGRLSCDISLAGVNDDGEKVLLTSQTFFVQIARSQAISDGVVNNENYHILVSLIRDVREMQMVVKELDEHLRKSEGEREIAEGVRRSNETIRQSAEAVRNSKLC